MSGYVLSVDADFDLDDIWEYIAADSIDAATVGSESCSTHLKPLAVLRAWVTGAKT